MPRKDKQAALAYNRAWRLANPEWSKAYNLAYFRNNRARELLRKYLRGDAALPILKAYESGCAYCGFIGDLEVDHKIPRSRGGTNSPNNLQWLCRKCNHAKYDMLEEEFISHIRRVLDRLEYGHRGGEKAAA